MKRIPKQSFYNCLHFFIHAELTADFRAHQCLSMRNNCSGNNDCFGYFLYLISGQKEKAGISTCLKIMDFLK